MDFVHCKHNPTNSYYSHPIKMNFTIIAVYNKKKSPRIYLESISMLYYLI